MISKIMMKWLLVVLGCALVYDSLDVSAKLPSGCDIDNLINANRGILVIGTMFISAGLSWLILADSGADDMNTYSFVAFFGVLGIVLTVLASTVNSNASDDADKVNDNKTAKAENDSPTCTPEDVSSTEAAPTFDVDKKVHASITMMVGVVSIIATTGYIGFQVYNAQAGGSSFM